MSDAVTNTIHTILTRDTTAAKVVKTTHLGTWIILCWDLEFTLIVFICIIRLYRSLCCLNTIFEFKESSDYDAHSHKWECLTRNIVTWTRNLDSPVHLSLYVCCIYSIALTTGLIYNNPTHTWQQAAHMCITYTMQTIIASL